MRDTGLVQNGGRCDITACNKGVVAGAGKREAVPLGRLHHDVVPLPGPFMELIRHVGEIGPEKVHIRRDHTRAHHPVRLGRPYALARRTNSLFETSLRSLMCRCNYRRVTIDPETIPEAATVGIFRDHSDLAAQDVQVNHAAWTEEQDGLWVMPPARDHLHLQMLA